MRKGARVSLRVAAAAADRDAAIASWLQTLPAETRTGRRIVMAEGLLFDREGPEGVPLSALAAGCPCCAGLLALRVLLARALRKHRPAALLLLPVGDGHLPRLRQMLAGGELGVCFEVDC